MNAAGTCEALLREVEESRDDIVGCLQALVRIPSITGDEAALAAHLVGLLTEMGFSIEVLEAAPGRPNIIATLDSGRPGKTLLLNDHLDIVPPGPLEHWTHPPFAAEIADGRVFGRGTIDTKSGVTTIIMAVRAFLKAKVAFGGKLRVIFDCDEEVAGDLGIKFLAKEGRLVADMALVTEPTTMQVEIATKGRLDLIIETTGLATHGARPWLGQNAIEDMMLVIGALQDYARSLESRRHDLLGRASLNIGTIQGGTVGNMVPSHCRIEVDRRVLPQENVDAVIAEIQGVIDGVVQAHPRIKASLRKRIWWSGYHVPEDADVVQTLCRAFEKIIGRKPVVAGKDSGTDAPYIFLSGTPVVMFSPGNGQQAMNADESVDIEDLVLATKVVAQFIYDVLA
jgi:succinyl-diaminopimelate desuccinylase